VKAQTMFALAYVFGVLWLAGWELAALVIDKTGGGDYTLSRMTWDFEGVGWTAARYLVLVALTWLTLHLAFRVLR
jgi:hypothetical protein